MKTPALHQAIRLYKYPQEMEWLTFPESELPEGVTDLLRLCASPKKLSDFSVLFKIKETLLKKVMMHFIEEVLLTTTNPDHKFIGLNHNHDDAKRKLHYQLLMKIYHPDKNASEDAADKTSKITTAYKKLNTVLTTNNSTHDIIRESTDPRTPPNSFYRATQQAEQSLSQTKNSFFAVASLALFSLLSVSIYITQSSAPELIVQNKVITAPSIPAKTVNHNKLHSNAFGNPQLVASISHIDDLEPQLEVLLHQLEESYESGNVEIIEPILSNTPDISSQTSEQISAKLKTLFEITQERKMLLYDFSWKNIAGTIQGEGKFLSRYQFTNEDQWLTRDGIALISAEIKDQKLNIISLQLNNRNIEQ
ncbi:MAG TPA: J domain-containing protein [Leucothrix sp.]|nr:J domain-containing protein [Leucothrix sp.]